MSEACPGSLKQESPTLVQNVVTSHSNSDPAHGELNTYPGDLFHRSMTSELENNR
jgi:hypothetical protein